MQNICSKWRNCTWYEHVTHCLKIYECKQTHITQPTSLLHFWSPEDHHYIYKVYGIGISSFTMECLSTIFVFLQKTAGKMKKWPSLLAWTTLTQWHLVAVSCRRKNCATKIKTSQQNMAALKSTLTSLKEHVCSQCAHTSSQASINFTSRQNENNRQGGGTQNHKCIRN